MKKIDRNRISEMCISPDCTIRQAMEAINRSLLGTAFIVRPGTLRFLGLVSDGDIRRALLNGHNLEAKIECIEKPKPKTASIEMEPEEISKLFSERIRIIPVLDSENKIADVAFYDQRLRLPVAEPFLSERELELVKDCIASNWISSAGMYVDRFEELFAGFCGSRFAVSTSSGTTALHLALLALDIKRGDEVIIPSLTFIATANAVTYTGATPVFVDSERETWNIDPKKIKVAISSKTKAIIPVHLYGYPADMDPIMEIAKQNGLAVIEDAAEAHGAEYKERKVGAIGDMGIFSFYGNKIITTGEGGMIVTNDARIAKRTRFLRAHGMSESRHYWHPEVGYNYRLTNIQAAIGVAQVEKINFIIQKKIEIAKYYEDRLKEIKGVTLPPKAMQAKNVYWLYSILVEENDFGMGRDELMKRLKSMDIETRPFFPPLHTQPIYNNGQRLKICEEIASKGLSLPSSANMRLREIDRVCYAVRELSQKNAIKITMR